MKDIWQKSDGTPSPWIWIAHWVCLCLALGSLVIIPLVAMRQPGATSDPSVMIMVLLLLAVREALWILGAKCRHEKKKPNGWVRYVHSDASTYREKELWGGLFLLPFILLFERMEDVPGTHINWPRLLALNGVCVSSGLGLAWLDYRLSEMKKARIDAAVIQSVTPLNPSRTEKRQDSQMRQSEGIVTTLAFLCFFAALTLAFLPTALSYLRQLWGLWLAGAVTFALFSGLCAMAARKARHVELMRPTSPQLQDENNTLRDALDGAKAACGGAWMLGLLFFISIRPNWLLFVLASIGQLGIYLLLRWTLSWPVVPTASEIATLSAMPQASEWVPLSQSAR